MQVATVTSAMKLENEQQFQIAKKLQEITGASRVISSSLFSLRKVVSGCILAYFQEAELHSETHLSAEPVRIHALQGPRTLS